MATIGKDATSTGTGFKGASDNHWLMDGANTWVATAGQEVYEVGWYSDDTTGTMEVGVYDITGGANTLVASASVTVTATGRTAQAITPVSLTSGNTYAVGFRCVNNVQIDRQAVTDACSRSALTGTSALADPFVDNTTTEGQEYSCFATTQASGGSISAVDSPVLDAETSNTLTVSGFGASVNDVDIRAVEDNNHNVDVSFSGTDPNLTFNMPDVSAFTVDTLGTPFDSTYWSHEIVVTDGTDSPTATIVVNPQANWARVDLAETPDVGTGSVLENFTGFYDAVSAVATGNPATLTVADTSDWVTGQEVTLAGFTTTPDINGTQTITVATSTTVTIPVNVTVVTDGVGTMYTGAASEHGQLYYPTSDSTSITSAGILTTDKTSNFTVLYFDTVDSKWKPFTVAVSAASTVGKKVKGMLKALGKMM